MVILIGPPLPALAAPGSSIERDWIAPFATISPLALIAIAPPLPAGVLTKIREITSPLMLISPFVAVKLISLPLGKGVFAVFLTEIPPIFKLAPEIETAPPLVWIVSPGCIEKEPTPSLSVSALNAIEPVIALRLRTPLLKLSIVILSVASKMIFASLGKDSSAASDMVKVAPGLSPARIWLSVNSPSLGASIPPTIMISFGSSNSVPVLPFGAVKSTLPAKNSVSFPDISTNPPFPELLPPLALMLP